VVAGDLLVVSGLAAAGELGDFGVDVVCAATGTARSMLKPIAAK
jgi:hypothetical protein